MKKLTNFGIDVDRSQAWPRFYNAKLSQFNATAGLALLEDF